MNQAKYLIFNKYDLVFFFKENSNVNGVSRQPYLIVNECILLHKHIVKINSLLF